MEVLRAIHVGVLCVQKYPEDRPNMSSVVLMLGDEGQLPKAKQPGFFMERNVVIVDAENSFNIPASNSNDDITITLIEAR